MAQRKQVRMAEMKVGLLVTMALIIIAALILQQSWGVAWFASAEKAITYLSDVGGLKPGAPVWLAGIEIGKVREVSIVPPQVYAGNAPLSRQIVEIKGKIESIDPATVPNAQKVIADYEERIRTLKLHLRFVQVKLEIRSEYLNRIGVDSEVAIESRGLIGDSFLEISPGAYGVLPKKQGEFYVIEGISKTGFREIMTGANDVIANFGVLSDQVKDIALKINPDQVGSGLAGTIEDMQKALKEADKTFAHTTLLVDDLRQGGGTFGKLVSDPGVYDRLTAALEKFNTLAGDIQSGSGTLAKLIHDPSVFDHAGETLRKAEIMMDRIERGEGTLGLLSKDAQLHDTTKEAIDRLASIVEQINRGDGTMGKLLKDPALYNNLNQSTAEITKLIYDLRQDPKKYMTIQFRLF